MSNADLQALQYRDRNACRQFGNASVNLPRAPLPIDEALPEALARLREARALVLEAPPGAGKTTRLPIALVTQGLVGDGSVVVLEPRRLAARMAARRVADELGERPGDTVGFQVRFEEVASARTRVRYVTEGVLSRRLLSDPELRGVGAVVLDEFHERHLQGDVALGLLRRLQRSARPDLLLAVMSATLDAEPVARYLSAPRVRSEGRRYDVSVEHLPRADDAPLASQVASAVRALLEDGLDGHVLVFLPGAAEIRRALAACERLARESDLALVPLHGDLPPADQDRAVAPSARRKVILSTNVAETSVTIDGVVAVVDSGLARVAGHAPWSGLPTLKVAKVSRASATQRAGRAGRTRPGRCLRLYTKHDHDARPEHDAPEVRRLDLAESALELHAAGVRNISDFEWFEAPSEASWGAAVALLEDLGARGPDGHLTPLGRRMLRLPVHPRLARVLVEAEDRGCTGRAAILAALLGERDIIAERRGAGLSPRSGAAPQEPATLDPEELVDLFERAAYEGLRPDAVRALGLDVGAVQAVDRVRRQLERALRRRDDGPLEALRLALLAGYGDRVGRRVKPHEYALAGGGSCAVAGDRDAALTEFVVVVDAQERAEGRGRQVVLRSAAPIEPEWLLELFPDAVKETDDATWDAANERAVVVRRLTYRALVLDETRALGAGSAAASRLLAERARAAGPGAFTDPEGLERLRTRVAFAREALPEAGFEALDDARVNDALAALCEGLASFRELREARLLDALRGALGAERRRLLDALAPERVALPGGRWVAVQYERAQRPWIASRLQDFFGMPVGPAVAGGRVPLVLHLLAPNQRAVQVTTDLAGFWERHYPGIRKELCRRYPKHSWPEDGRSAVPPAVLGRKR
ncbi:MAG: ATP-dependent helicase HrpB [Deltaproteobacteria bacterium]|nr:ATP-dependent helicase HrpB [Deltaproteobacteria bacterium]